MQTPCRALRHRGRQSHTETDITLEVASQRELLRRLKLERAPFQFKELDKKE
jgi:hypothetical protein